MLKKKKYNIKSTKDTIRFIGDCLDEILVNEEDLEANANFVSLLQFYKDEFVFKSFLFNDINGKINLLMTPFEAKGINYNDEIYMFLRDYNKEKKKSPSKAFVEFLRVSFHELEHSRQRCGGSVFRPIDDSFNYSFENCAMNVYEDFIIKNDYIFYLRYHDYFLTEIDANLYAAIKARRIINRNQELFDTEMEYKKALKHLNIEAKTWFDWRDSYDFDLIFKRYNELKKENLNLLDILIYENNTPKFKRIADIYNADNFDKFDRHLIDHIITSQTYINQFDIEKLSKDEVYILIRALSRFEKIYNDYKKEHRDVNIADVVYESDNDVDLTAYGIDFSYFYHLKKRMMLLDRLKKNLKEGLYDRNDKDDTNNDKVNKDDQVSETISDLGVDTNEDISNDKDNILNKIKSKVRIRKRTDD